MNSLKILVNSWESLHPAKRYEEEEEDVNSNPIERADSVQDPMVDMTAMITNDEDLDKQIRTSTDQQLHTTTLRLEDDEDDEKEYDIDDSTDLIEKKLVKNEKSQSIFSKVIGYILFIPYYMIVKPLLLFWSMAIYPFASISYFKKQEHFDSINGIDTCKQTSKDGSTNNQDKISISSAENDNDIQLNDSKNLPSVEEKIELLKQENMISNSIKTPTLSSKYLIPPPQRLFPLSRNPNRKKKKKTLILDLDETLIHSLSRGSLRSFNRNISSEMIEIKLHNISSLYYVYKRPYCDYFLKEVAKWFELQIFTASVKEYADPIINWLESEIGTFKSNSNYNLNSNVADGQVGRSENSTSGSIFTKRYYRTDCTYRPGVGYIKDLSKFFEREDLKNVIILDNSPVSYALHENNAVMIEGWINDSSDRDLVNLLPMLHSLSLCIDVRYILGLRSGERVFES